MRALLFIMATIIVRGGVWMHPRSVICLVDYLLSDLLLSGDWYCVQYMPFTYIWELATPFEE